MNATYAYIRLVDPNIDTLVLAISWRVGTPLSQARERGTVERKAPSEHLFDKLINGV